MTQICLKLQLSRAAFYKQCKAAKADEEHKISLLTMVTSIKIMMPMMGGRKLYHELKAPSKQGFIKMGRDKFFSFLAENDMLVKRKRRYAKTTNSNHGFRIYPNLLREQEVTAVDQAWVSDITYVRHKTGFSYLALITDVFSRKVIGYDISDSLGAEGSLRALKMALKKRKGVNTTHHSDRGIQYCCKEYQQLLRNNQIKISHAAKGDCYENAIAERVNGILKTEFGLAYKFKDPSQVLQAVNESIYIYNHHRPHWSINLLKPADVYAA